MRKKVHLLRFCFSFPIANWWTTREEESHNHKLIHLSGKSILCFSYTQRSHRSDDSLIQTFWLRLQTREQVSCVQYSHKSFVSIRLLSSTSSSVHFDLANTGAPFESITYNNLPAVFFFFFFATSWDCIDCRLKWIIVYYTRINFKSINANETNEIHFFDCNYSQSNDPFISS